MAEMEQFRDKLQAMLKGMTLGQKLTISTTLIVGILGFVFLFRWATAPDYALLYSGLELAEADQIVQSLQAQNVPYRLTAGGHSVMVPSGEVYAWRVRLASEGLPTTGSVGYEVFDQNEIGVSDFVQKVNYQRAIEGELARTIQTIQGIKQARVHIVIPEDRLFKADQHEPTASIVLHLAGNRRLRDEQVMGIANMVSASVEGLTPGNVKIVDAQGRILSAAYDSDSMMGVTSTQLDIQRRVEAHLTEKVQTPLSRVLGEGNAIVRVTADLDFQRIARTREDYDGERTAVLSEERSEQSSQDPQNATGQTEYFTTNYNVPKTVEHIVESVGDIQRLSVSVLVNHRRELQTDAQGVETVNMVPRTPEEIANLTRIVRNALGFDDARGDQVAVENILFNEPESLLDDTSGQFFGIDGQYLDIAQKALPVVFLLIFLLMIRSRLRRMRVTVPAEGPVRGRQLRPVGPGGQMVPVSSEGIPLPQLDEGASPEAVESAQLLQQISDFVEDKPSAAVKLIRYWLLEE
jgi:flagellar M-ring protein FliF